MYVPIMPLPNGLSVNKVMRFSILFCSAKLPTLPTLRHLAVITVISANLSMRILY